MDGYAAACEVKRNLQDKEWNKVHYIPAAYSWLNKLAETNDVSIIPAMTTHLLFVDICPCQEVLDLLINLGFYITIVDHHKEARVILSHTKNQNREELKFLIADKYSGASLVKAIGGAINYVLTHECEVDYTAEGECGYTTYLTNNDLHVYLERDDVTDSLLYSLLEIRDIWITKDPKLKEDADILATYFKDINLAKNPIVDNLEELYPEEQLYVMIEQYRAIIESQRKMLNDNIRNSYTSKLVTGCGKDVTVTIGECPDMLGSMFGDMVNTRDAGNTIAVAIFHNFAKNEIGMSLRSKGGVPCRLVANAFGGGGHDHASGAGIGKHMVTTMNSLILNIEAAIKNLHIVH